MDFQNQIITAIKSRRQLKINYKNEGHRIIYPHILYFSSTGNKLLDAYQISGYSEHPEDIPTWRPYYISKITELIVLNDKFEIVEGYNPSNRDRYPTIIEKI